MQFTLHSARVASGYTVDEAAKQCGVSIAQMEGFEKDPGEIPKIIACKMKKMYNISLDSLIIK